MLFSYLKSAYRSITKSKLFTVINVFGLSIGISAFVLILYYVLFEKSFDKYNDDYERIYRIRYERYSEDGSSVKFASCCPPAGDLIRERFTGVDKLGKLFKYNAVIARNNIKFMEERVFFAEPQIFEIFKFNFIEGSALEGIKNPGNAFISESTAIKYFGEENPIGKEFIVNGGTTYQVAGVYNNMPDNSHLKMDIILSFQNLLILYGDEYHKEWGHTGMYTYVKLSPDADLKLFEKNLDELVHKEFGEALEYFKMTMKLPMQPLKDIHLNSNYMQEYEVNGNKDSVDLLFIIAIFVIIMAWINYINLSTAGALSRAKEVGLRKVVGANRKNLVFQFFTETALLNIFAITVSLIIIFLLTPFFNNLTGMSKYVSIWNQPWLIPVLLGLFVFGVMFSGFYPVIAMSSYKPALVLKGSFQKSSKGTKLRKTLIVFQFAIAFILITSTLTVYEQISFMRSQDLGFNIDQTLVVQAPRIKNDDYSEKLETYKNVLKTNSNVKNVSHVTEVPGRQIYWDAGGIRKMGEDANKGKNYQIIGVDYNFVNLFDVKLAAGRNFSKEFPTDNKSLILNETAVKFMGFEENEEAIGKQVDYWDEIFTIVGVIKNYHQQSLKEEFEPHLFRLMPEGRGRLGQIALKISTADVSRTIELVKNKFEEFFPGNPFIYFFLDEYFNQQYKSDQQFGSVIGVFSVIAGIITLLGIFGLSLHNALQKTKEIGIRKVLGADVISIIYLLSKDFFVLIAVSFFISLPILIYGLTIFLNDYANRINLNAWLFITPVIIIVGITMLTIIYQFIKAAFANPVDSLKYE